MKETNADITCEYCGLPFSPDWIAEHHEECKEEYCKVVTRAEYLHKKKAKE